MTIAPEVMEVVRRLRRGETIHCEHADGETQWWFEKPLLEVSSDIAAAATKRLGRRYRLRPAGDGLFDDGHSQSWTAEPSVREVRG